ncbi:hypothetical protein [Paraburkholderia humisilvae]|uniref:Uncharacterized protein n=2 Tax=Paraburkholderia humisilvae TaxID=627669 RepID=A0A6J5DK30_9BURK|nr:hypothetical protein [Paraburkholderia humisilvae]CAB3754650.1 hypothetical protein LMG29542_02411 [Paraburkholderia humisilvae]
MFRQFARGFVVARLFKFAAMFDRRSLSFVRRVASWNLLYSAGLTALVGGIVVLYGCAYEASAQVHLLQGSGRAALDAYLAQVSAHQLSFGAFLVESVTGRCYAISAAVQGLGFWMVFGIAPVVASLVLLARFEVRMTQRSVAKAVRA